MGLAILKTEGLEDVEPGIHAGDDGQLAAGLDIEMLVGNPGGKGPVVLDQVVDYSHRRFYWLWTSSRSTTKTRVELAGIVGGLPCAP